MKRRDILNILFWIFLILGIILLVWRLLGKSPDDLSILFSFVFMLLMKIWSTSDELKEFKTDYTTFKKNVKSAFENIKEDNKDTKEEIGSLKNFIKKGIEIS